MRVATYRLTMIAVAKWESKIIQPMGPQVYKPIIELYDVPPRIRETNTVVR